MNKQKTLKSKVKVTNSQTATPIPLIISPGKVLRGDNILSQSGAEISRLGDRPLIIGGDRTLTRIESYLQPIIKQQKLQAQQASYLPDCAESSLVKLKAALEQHQADFIIGVGGGKA